MTGAVAVDAAGAQMGGAARFAAELRSYVARSGRQDIRVIGATRRLGASWLIQREMASRGTGRKVALNNVTFAGPGGEKWTLLRNALHFLAAHEASDLGPIFVGSLRRDATIVRLTARWADVLVVPCGAMADRVSRIIPAARDRIVVRAHPVSADPLPLRQDAAILCPVLFAPYKRMNERLTELIAAVNEVADPSVRVRVTASRADVSPQLAADPRMKFLGRLDQRKLREVRANSRALYFPTGLESFGYPLAEARVNGQPVIARDTAQNREIAGPALCGFRSGDPASLRRAVGLALTTAVSPDPAPFDPDAYFDWMLGDPT